MLNPTSLTKLALSQPRRGALVAFALAHVGLVWLLPVLPAQDLPQHLSYVRILLDYHDPGLRFAEHFQYPERFQPYFTAYYVLLAIARISSVEVAARVLVSLYALGTMGAFSALVRAFHRGAPSTAVPTALLGSLLVWSPVFCMGFLAFSLAVPLFLLACAALVRVCEAPAGGRHHAVLAIAVAAIASVHAVAAGAFAAFAALYATLAPERRRIARSALAVGGLVAVHAAWSRLGEHGLGSFGVIRWSELLREAQGLEFVDEALQVRWNGTSTKLSYLAWTALGPYRWPPLVAIGAGVLVAACIVARRAPLGAAARDRMAPATKRAVVGFFVLCWAAPWGLFVPSEITFLDFRLLTLAFGLLLACVPPRWLVPREAWLATVVGCACLLVHFAYRAHRFGQEARSALRLLAEAKPSAPMLPLVFQNTSAHFATQFGVSHFLPMYYTIRNGGVSAQFWGRFTDHLPVAFKPGKQPYAPSDWRPWEFQESHLEGFGYVLVQAALPTDPAKARVAHQRALDVLSRRAERLRCDGDWCLFRVRP